MKSIVNFYVVSVDAENTSFGICFCQELLLRIIVTSDVELNRSPSLLKVGAIKILSGLQRFKLQLLRCVSVDEGNYGTARQIEPLNGIR